MRMIYLFNQMFIGRTVQHVGLTRPIVGLGGYSGEGVSPDAKKILSRTP